ncbi:MAG: methionine adenosyltransferase [Oscillospiraceae bacterium]|nr:methionine adenosyltransferase [Oscillospiraceae bacterium]
MSRYIFTSESVTEGHPDKVADRISDSILDAYLAKDPAARVAAETVIKNNTVILAGEISSSAEIDTEKVVRDAINDIGYNSEELGFDGHSAEIINLLDRQSPDIAQGVDSALEVREENGNEIGAGDQGIIFGYAVNETPELLPLPISLAHRLSYRLAEVRKNGTLPYLRPDGKTQVSVIYEDGNAVGIDTILVSTQHDEEVSQDKLRADLIKHVIIPVIPKKWLTSDIRILVNPTGRFVIGGPVGDSGLTGRKIIVDTYGGAAHHGGGAFSGKDSTKVDRSAAYAARYAAKNIVAAGLAKRAEIQLAYAIGVAAPVSVYVNTFGTGVITDEEIQTAVTEIFDFTPGGIIRALDLRKPVFAATSAYGHFGRPDADFTWERTDKAEALKKAVRKVTKYAG